MTGRSGRSRSPSGNADRSRRGADSLRVERPTALLSFLREHLPDEGRNSIKALLSRGRVLVDGRVTTRFDYPLSRGERVTIARGRGPIESSEANAGARLPSGHGAFAHGRSRGAESTPGLRILFEDEHLIVIDKEAGLLSIATPKERERTAYHVLTDHVRRADPRGRLFIVHRLDRESSGVMVFAKSPAAKRGLQDAWREVVEKRSYTVVVEGDLPKPRDTIVSWLTEDRSLTMRASEVDNGGKRAVAHYRVVKRGGGCTLLEVELETGRKNQIRAQMQSIGHSVVGDARYGAKGNPIGRLALHARQLSFRHPISGRALSFESPVPKAFYRLVGRPAE